MKVRDWSLINYFDSYEFDSPDVPGSGANMEEEFILLLDRARKMAGEEGKKYGLRIVFHINSGFRTQLYNSSLKNASKNSAHLRGWAADIRIRNNQERRIILNSLIEVGLDRRIGMSDTFIHVDYDPSLIESYWTYPIRKSFIKQLFGENKPEDV